MPDYTPTNNIVKSQLDQENTMHHLDQIGQIIDGVLRDGRVSPAAKKRFVCETQTDLVELARTLAMGGHNA